MLRSKPTIIEFYEIPNTFTRDISLEEQIEIGICDWQVSMSDGAVIVGHTQKEALENARDYMATRGLPGARPHKGLTN